jgi:endonuclease/exonuclease/phosphatase family metal-dependent hydrolase
LPTTKFLFWNINRKPLGDIVADLADTHGVDLVALAECSIEPATLLRKLNLDRTGGFQFPPSVSKGVMIFTRFSRGFLHRSFESERVSIRRLALPARSEVLIVAVHFPSKLYWSNDSQASECTELARQIDLEENKVGHQRTVLFGDFNMNPFEAGLVSAAGLNSVMSRRVAARLRRTVQGRQYRFFYNPMWGHLGDRSSDTAGSYYYDRAEHVNYFWNVFDQVLLRPELAEGFHSDQIRILTSVGERSLVRPDGRPDTSKASDHLPIIFELAF